MIWLQDTGILKKLRDDALKAPVPVPRLQVKSNRPLNIYQLATAFLLMTAGILFSVSLLFVELLNGRKREGQQARSRKNKNDISPNKFCAFVHYATNSAKINSLALFRAVSMSIPALQASLWASLVKEQSQTGTIPQSRHLVHPEKRQTAAIFPNSWNRKPRPAQDDA